MPTSQEQKMIKRNRNDLLNEYTPQKMPKNTTGIRLNFRKYLQMYFKECHNIPFYKFYKQYQKFIDVNFLCNQAINDDQF